MKRVFYFIFCSILIYSCNRNKSISEELIGKWHLVDIKDGDIDINKERNPKGDRIIEFNKDGTYFSSGAGTADRSGKWNLDTVKNILSLDSDAGPGDDTRWTIELKDDTFYTRGKKPMISTVTAKWVKSK